MYETIILFFCKYNICKHDEQNVLKMKFILVCLNCKISSKQLSITDLFEEKSDFDARINETFYLSFIGLRVKYKFSFVCCFLVFDTFQCFPSTIIFPEFMFSFNSPLKNDGLRIHCIYKSPVYHYKNKFIYYNLYIFTRS
jgi:hypothetical protein